MSLHLADIVGFRNARLTPETDIRIGPHLLNEITAPSPTASAPSPGSASRMSLQRFGTPLRRTAENKFLHPVVRPKYFYCAPSCV
jgi:hypothetical protein